MVMNMKTEHREKKERDKSMPDFSESHKPELHVLCIECPHTGSRNKPQWLKPSEVSEHMRTWHNKIVNSEDQINSWKALGVYFEKWI